MKPRSTNLLVRTFGAAMLFLLGADPAARAVTLVENNTPSAVIVLADNPSPAARQAAKIFQSHVKQISGAEIGIVPEGKVDTAKKQSLVFIGEGRLAKERGFTAEGLSAGGFLAQAKGDALAIVGTDQRTLSDYWGSVYGTAWCLESKLGVRYLWPGESGKVVPKQGTITIADFQYQSSPKLAQRNIRSMGYNDRLQEGLNRLHFTKEDFERLRNESSKTASETCSWFQWQGLGGTLNIAGGHAFGGLWDKYGKDHPDWFAMQPNGSREQIGTDRSRLCKSNPDLIAAIAKDKIEEIEKNPNLLGVSLCPNDGGRSTFCTCPKCEALDAPNAPKIQLWDFTGKERRSFEHVALTDRMVYFWNAIAEQVTKVHPDKLFTVDAYSVYATPPVMRAMHPNLVVRFAALEYGDEKGRMSARNDWDAWAKMAKRIYFRSNCMLAGRRTGMPLIYVHRFAEDFRHFVDTGMMGTDLDSCTHNWATQGLNYYVAARLHSDPNQDVDAMIDDYCRAGFGPAAKTMRRYYDLQESVFAGTASRQENPNEGFTDAVLADLRKLIEQAAGEATSDPDAARRVAFVALGERWTELEVQAQRLLTSPTKPDAATVKRVLDERYAFMRDHFEKNPAAFNFAYISWGEDAGWGKIGWTTPK
jgi:hypothetical protein